MGKRTNSEAIKSYYDNNQFLYSFLWSRSASHYGFWEKETASLSEAILNTNKFIKNCLDIKKDDVILDAGCGVGGTSIYLARECKARVRGIALSDVQIKIAKENALKEGVSDSVDFSCQDFTKTSFKNSSFTKIFGIESVCHASEKLDFLKEAFRLLKPGGKIAVVDAFLIKKNMSEKEKKAYENFLIGWAVPNLYSKENFEKGLKKAGFENIIFYDKSEQVKKSSKRIYLLSIAAYPITWFLSKIKFIPQNVHGNTIACYNQKKVVDCHLVAYGVFVAEKLL